MGPTCRRACQPCCPALARSGRKSLLEVKQPSFSPNPYGTRRSMSFLGGGGGGGGCSPAERPPCREVGAAGGGIMVREGGRGVEQEGRMPRNTHHLGRGGVFGRKAECRETLIALAAEECLAWLKLGISSNKGIIRTLFTVLSRIITNKCIIAS